jgi:hypothetical protein
MILLQPSASVIYICILTLALSPSDSHSTSVVSPSLSPSLSSSHSSSSSDASSSSCISPACYSPENSFQNDNKNINIFSEDERDMNIKKRADSSNVLVQSSSSSSVQNQQETLPDTLLPSVNPNSNSNNPNSNDQSQNNSTLQPTVLNRKVLKIDWTIGFVTANPDGLFPRTVVGVNGKWPIPPIEAEQGDLLILNLVNNNIIR